MWFALALAAALLTSILPIINKRLLADTPVPTVAWGVNALSLPLLGVFAVLLLPLPAVDSVFWLGVLGSAVLNLVATLVSTQALKLGEASLVTPLLTFNPAFTLAIATIALGEVPSWHGVAGVVVILWGSYVLSLSEAEHGWWRPLAALVTRPAMVLALAASFIWGLTPITEKLAMQHSDPSNPPLVAFASTALMALFLVPMMLRSTTQPLRYLQTHRRGFLLAAGIAGVAPVFGFTAIGLGFVGYVTAVFKVSTVFSVIWAAMLLKESATRDRLVGATLMVLGTVVVAL